MEENTLLCNSEFLTLAKLRGLSVWFDEKTVLSNLCFEIGYGELVEFHGENGCGKTTLLKCFAGLIKPDKGDVEFFCEKQKNSLPVDYCGDSSFLYDFMSIRENLDLYSQLCKNDNSENLVEELLEDFSLEDSANILIRDCSTGYRKKASIARALISDPELLILDEPFNAIDSKGYQVVCSHIEERLAKGKSVILVSHFRDFKINHKSTCYEITNGKVVDFS